MLSSTSACVLNVNVGVCRYPAWTERNVRFNTSLKTSLPDKQHKENTSELLSVFLFSSFQHYFNFRIPWI